VFVQPVLQWESHLYYIAGVCVCVPLIKILLFKIVWPCIVTDSLWIRPTNALNYNFIGITNLHVSGSLSAHHQEFLAVHRLPGAVAPGSKRSSQLQKMYQSRCTAKNSWWWAERLPETCRVVIPIKLEFGAFVGLIHNERNWCFQVTSGRVVFDIPRINLPSFNRNQ